MDSSSFLINPTEDRGDGPILLVEDDRGFTELLKHRLGKHHRYIDAVSDGQTALESMRASQPDVVITDWMMPDMNGLELCEAIRRDPELRYVYVIVLSSMTETNAKIKALDAGV